MDQEKATPETVPSRGEAPLKGTVPRVPHFESYAIFQTGGKQYQAIPGKTVAVEKLDANVGETVEFKEVLFRKKGEGEFEFGAPYITGATLKASIVKQTKGPKLVIFKFKRRKKYRVKKGHRQPMTVIRIESI
jgi:large subunit ribosomal protein L21